MPKTTQSSVDEPPLVLAIETSCDETAVAIARGTDSMLTSEVSSQIEIHKPYGGVVPELASRNHNLTIRPLIELALKNAGVTIDEIDCVAATAGPGLASALLIGDTTAKSLAVSLNKPFYSINHLEGHLLSPFVGNSEGVIPGISLVVSGGHTLLIHLKGVGDYQVLGSTKDDAAGEAFDKVGKMLELPYPGGPEIDLRSRRGDPAKFDFPRSMLDSGDFQFSFSGLKTSVFYGLKKLPQPLDESTINNLCASFQEAVVDVLVAKTLRAAAELKQNVVSVSGGVSCNRRLRTAMQEACDRKGVQLVMTAPTYSTDNAAMIAYAAAARVAVGIEPSPLNTDINPNLKLA